MTQIRAIESTAMLVQEPQPGLQELMTYLEEKGVRMAICTRNFDAPVNHLLQKFLPNAPISPIITRSFRPPKPDPAGILHIASTWGLTDAQDLIMGRVGWAAGQAISQKPFTSPLNSNKRQVGDSIDDMTAGFRAGSATVLLLADSAENAPLRQHPHTGFCIDRLDDLIKILEMGFEEEGGGGSGV
ncbi:hypothetical protein MMC07_001372 [Pseudocyphellaria aurata]|nr:hypothetical protein [Pseudocyphellaria aurata]